MLCENRQWHPNRAYFQLSGEIVIDSGFPSGNIGSAVLISPLPLVIQVEGNTDVCLDALAKYWLYFRLKITTNKLIKFVLKNANHLRKFVGQNKYKPYMVYKKDGEQWQPTPTQLESLFNDKNQIQGSFFFRPEKIQENGAPRIYYFAMYYPYSTEDLFCFLKSTQTTYEQITSKGDLAYAKPYYNEETICYSTERRKVQLITITSSCNVDSFSHREQPIHADLFPNPKDRPFKLKHCPIILITGRVHPSETMASFFIEGFVQFLMSDNKLSYMLKKMFIFLVFPMLNPDGVDNGNFRFDSQMRNLNRFYGHSNMQKTQILLQNRPSVFAVQKVIQHLREVPNQLFMYLDIHGHQSPKQSFMFGNHTEHLTHMIENRLFCKLVELNTNFPCFSRADCQFSKRNMTIQQKYDEYSKLCSGRVFVGKAEDADEKQIFHAYTLELTPYIEDIGGKKKITATTYAKQVSKSILVSILDLLGINPESKFQFRDMLRLRSHSLSESYNQWGKRLIMKKKELMQDRLTVSDAGKEESDQYIKRWFHNESYLLGLEQDEVLLKEQCFIDFCRKINNSNGLMKSLVEVVPQKKTVCRVKPKNLVRLNKPNKVSAFDCKNYQRKHNEEHKLALQQNLWEFEENDTIIGKSTRQIKGKTRKGNQIELQSRKKTLPIQKYEKQILLKIQPIAKEESKTDPRGYDHQFISGLSRQKYSRVKTCLENHKFENPSVQIGEIASISKQYAESPLRQKSFIEHLFEQVRAAESKHRFSNIRQLPEINRQRPIFSLQTEAPDCSHMKIFTVRRKLIGDCGGPLDHAIVKTQKVLSINHVG